MKKKLLLIVATVFASFSISLAQSVVINKVINGTDHNDGGLDAVELLVIQDKLDMRGMIIKAHSPVLGNHRFSQNDLWKEVPAGTLIVLRRPKIISGTALEDDLTTGSASGEREILEEDVDLSDRVIMVNMTNPSNSYVEFVSGNGPKANRALNIFKDAVIVIKTSGSEVHDYNNVIHAFAVGNYPTNSANSANWSLLAAVPKIWLVSAIEIASSQKATHSIVAKTLNTTRSIADFNNIANPQPSPLVITHDAIEKFNFTHEEMLTTLGVANNNNNAAFISSLRAKYSNATFGLNSSSVTAAPAYVDGNVTNFSILPALPDGLTIDATSGVISGTPTTTQDITEYTVTITSAGVTATTKVNLTIVETLPVNLKDFYAKKTSNGVQLIWNTLSEKNNSHFEVLRSQDGVNYQKISTTIIDSKSLNGTSNELLNYNFYDANPISGTNYYKLKQVDKDGNIQDYLTVTNFQLPSDKLSIAAKGNDNGLNVFINSELSDLATVNIINLSGKVILSKEVKIEKGLNSLELPLILTNGIYVASISVQNQNVAIKFIK